MKYLKKFENNNMKKYWKIPIDEYIFPRLTKIGVLGKEQKSAYKHYLKLKKENYKILFIFVQKDIYGTYCGFNPKSDATLQLDDYIKQDDKDFELTEAEKTQWNLRKITKKYNI